MSDWVETTLGDTGTIVTGKTPSKNHPGDWGNIMPFVTPTDYGRYRKKATYAIRWLSDEGVEKLSNKVLPPSSVMVTCIGSDMGKVVMNDLSVITNQQINSIIPDVELCNPDFLYYRLISIYETLRTYGRDGTAVPIVNKGDFSNIKISLPPLPEQKAIAGVLSCLDNKIDLLHRQNKTLESLAKTLFHQWFIIEAQDDWEEGVLGEIVTVKGGSTPSTKNPNFWGGNILWTTPRDLSNNAGMYLLNTARKITKQGLKKISSGLLPAGTLLMSSRAPVGYLAFSTRPISINQGYIAIIDDKGFSKRFLYLWLLINMAKVKNYSNGSTFEEISKTSFKQLAISKPDIDTRNDFDQVINPLFQKIEKNTYQIKILESLRDTLLPKLMSGAVRVEIENNQKAEAI